MSKVQLSHDGHTKEGRIGKSDSQRSNCAIYQQIIKEYTPADRERITYAFYEVSWRLMRVVVENIVATYEHFGFEID